MEASNRPSQLLIFYDLETSGLLRSGQIYNFCFLVTDSELNEIDRFVGEVKPSVLQLPFAGAIAATKINILEQQQRGQYTEREAVNAIKDFLLPFSKGRKAPLLVGYNSAEFDIHQLRWSFSRNAVNSFALSNGYDVLLGARDLFLNNADFREVIFDSPVMTPRISLRLEKLSQALGIDRGPQLHESLDDVLLLKDTFRELRDRFHLTAESSSLYRIGELESHGFARVSFLNRSIGRTSWSKELELGFVRSIDKKFAAWIPLDTPLEELNRQPVSSLRLIKRGEEPVAGSAISEPTEAQRQIVAQAQNLLKDVHTLADLYPETPGEYETWIYRHNEVPKIMRDILRWPEKRETILAEVAADVAADVVQCLTRMKLEDASPEELRGALKGEFLEFVAQRYSGEMLVSKDGLSKHPGSKSSPFHPSLPEMYAELDKSLAETKDPRVVECLIALRTFYDNSPVREAFDLLVKSGRLSSRVADINLHDEAVSVQISGPTPGDSKPITPDL